MSAAAEYDNKRVFEDKVVQNLIVSCFCSILPPLPLPQHGGEPADVQTSQERKAALTLFCSQTETRWFPSQFAVW